MNIVKHRSHMAAVLAVLASRAALDAPFTVVPTSTHANANIDKWLTEAVMLDALPLHPSYATSAVSCSLRGRLGWVRTYIDPDGQVACSYSLID